MLKVNIETSGDDIESLLRAESRRLDDRVHRALQAAARDWRALVISSTWFNSRPSPDSQIITRIVVTGAGIVLEYGWIAFDGDHAKSEARSELRRRIFAQQTDQVLEAAINQGLAI
jgi:hypothetical protein